MVSPVQLYWGCTSPLASLAESLLITPNFSLTCRSAVVVVEGDGGRWHQPAEASVLNLFLRQVRKT